MAAYRARCKRFSLSAVFLGITARLTLTRGSFARNPNEKDVKPAPNAQDSDEIYEYEREANGELKRDPQGKPIVKTDSQGNPIPKVDGKIWVLDFKFKPLRSLKVNVPGRGEQ